MQLDWAWRGGFTLRYDIREKKKRLGPNASRIMGKGYEASTSLNPGIWGVSSLRQGLHWATAGATELWQATRGQTNTTFAIYLLSGTSSSPREGGFRGGVLDPSRTVEMAAALMAPIHVKTVVPSGKSFCTHQPGQVCMNIFLRNSPVHLHSLPHQALHPWAD